MDDRNYNSNAYNVSPTTGSRYPPTNSPNNFSNMNDMNTNNGGGVMGVSDPFGQMNIGGYNANTVNNGGDPSPMSPVQNNGMMMHAAQYQQPQQMQQQFGQPQYEANSSNVQHQQYQQPTQQPQQNAQPMMITPDMNANNNGTLVPVQQQYQNNQAQQYQNYQVDPFCVSPVVNLANDMYANTANNVANVNPFDAHPPSSNNSPNNQAAMASSSALSPPVSPLWTPASPQASPPSNNNVAGAVFAASATVGAPPSLNAPVASGNPFDMFDATPPAVPTVDTSLMMPLTLPHQQPLQQQQVQQPQHNQQDEADFWADMGFGNAPSSNDNATATHHNANTLNNNDNAVQQQTQPSKRITLDANSLPSGGEYYKARVTTQMLGAIFSSAIEVRNTLFASASQEFVDVLGKRPVCSFTIDGGAADTAGVCLGHVLLSVNGTQVVDTDQAVKLFGSEPRPLVMEYYIPPDVAVFKTEGYCMVKYDVNSVACPSSKCEWKGKYVVVGDMLGKPNVSQCIEMCRICLVNYFILTLFASSSLQ